MIRPDPTARVQPLPSTCSICRQYLGFESEKVFDPATRKAWHAWHEDEETFEFKVPTGRSE